MKTKAFYDLAHAYRYLKDSVIRLDKAPIYITNVLAGTKKNSDYVLKYIECGKTGEKTCNLAHKGIDMNPVKLGYIAIREAGTKYGAFYLQRVPNRTQHIGLCYRNISAYWNKALPLTDAQYHACLSVSFLQSKVFRNTVKNNYLSFDEAVAKAAADFNTVWPFSRRFAIHKTDLYFKYFDHPVGRIEDGEPILYDTSHFLKESLKEDR